MTETAFTALRKLHQRTEIDAKSCPEECEQHEDETDCPNIQIAICAHCYAIAEESNEYFAEQGIPESLLYPCPTITILNEQEPR